MKAPKEILDHLYANGKASDKYYEQHMKPLHFKALDDLYEAILEVIGENEVLDMGGSKEAVDRHNVSYDRNQLRVEQRKALAELFGRASLHGGND